MNITFINMSTLLHLSFYTVVKRALGIFVLLSSLTASMLSSNFRDFASGIFGFAFIHNPMPWCIVSFCEK